ncbi:MAG: ParB N-terminal domain-containing protein, partial [Gemmatimonadota bacterium]
PIVVTPPSAQGKYRIIAGHLQYEVCKLLGWKTISAVIVDKERTLADGPAYSPMAPLTTESPPKPR